MRTALLTIMSVLMRTAHSELEASCNALSQPHMYAYESCIVLHETPTHTWDQAVDTCDDIPASEDSEAGHLWHPTDKSQTVMQMLIDYSIASPITLHVGVYNVDQGGLDKDGWYYILDSSNATAIAEMQPAFWTWMTGRPAEVGRRSMLVTFDTAEQTADRLDAVADSAAHSHGHVCQYDKTARVRWKRMAGHDGQRPDDASTLHTEHVGHRLLCMASCAAKWGTSLCHAVAYEHSSGLCVHSLSITNRGGRWTVDPDGGQWKVWQLAP